MKINVETIPHNQQRYDTVGDYWIDKDLTLQIRISRMRIVWFEWFVLIHEIVEIAICLFYKISFNKIDKFDIQFEIDRKDGIHGENDEPGDDPDAPYKNAHCFATSVERMVCAVFGLSWKEYDEEVLGLDYNPELKNRIPMVD